MSSAHGPTCTLWLLTALTCAPWATKTQWCLLLLPTASRHASLLAAAAGDSRQAARAGPQEQQVRQKHRLQPVVSLPLLLPTRPSGLLLTLLRLLMLGATPKSLQRS